MTPSVGRIVHYTGFGDEQGGRCFTAVVTNVRVPNAGSVDLLVTAPPENITDTEIHQFVATDVTGGGNEPGHGQWHWPERVE